MQRKKYHTVATFPKSYRKSVESGTIVSLEMPVPSQGHYGFHSYPVVD
jgi:hypothetical protein